MEFLRGLRLLRRKLGAGLVREHELTNSHLCQTNREAQPTTLVLAIRSPADPHVSKTVHHRPSPCNSEGLADRVPGAIVQLNSQSSSKGRPALHQTTTPAALPFPPLADPGFGVLLTVSEVAARLRVSRAVIYGLVKRGDLPSVRVSNAIRVRRDAVEALSGGGS